MPLALASGLPGRVDDAFGGGVRGRKICTDECSARCTWDAMKQYIKRVGASRKQAETLALLHFRAVFFATDVNPIRNMGPQEAQRGLRVAPRSFRVAPRGSRRSQGGPKITFGLIWLSVED